jgi:hypothetical protein
LGFILLFVLLFGALFVLALVVVSIFRISGGWRV